MPELRRDHRDEAELDGRLLLPAELAIARQVAPVVDRFDVEVASLLQRLVAEQLIDKGRHLVVKETVERRPEHPLGPPGNLLRQITFAQEPQNVLVAEPAQLPARMD